MSEYAPPFFWLHIKKSAGSSVREILSPHYVVVDRTKHPETFIQVDPSKYNDILNNYRILIGNYQLKRSLFAKKYLYPESWDGMLSFCFSRNPVSRAVSMFYYLMYAAKKSRLMYSLDFLKPLYRADKSFDLFLDCVEGGMRSDTLFYRYGSLSIPDGLHFVTHTAPMWGDVTDDEGRVIMKRIYRLECLEPALR